MSCEDKDEATSKQGRCRSSPVAGDGVAGAGDGDHDPCLVVVGFRQCVRHQVAPCLRLRHVLVGSVCLRRENRSDAALGWQIDFKGAMVVHSPVLLLTQQDIKQNRIKCRLNQFLNIMGK